MSSLFDLTKISEIIKIKRLTRILLVDTNVVMNNPDPKNWLIAAQGANLFVLSDTVVQELEYIKQKKARRRT